MCYNRIRFNVPSERRDRKGWQEQGKDCYRVAVAEGEVGGVLGRVHGVRRVLLERDGARVGHGLHAQHLHQCVMSSYTELWSVQYELYRALVCTI